MLSPTRCIALVMSIVIIASLYRRMDRGSLEQVLEHLDPRWLFAAFLSLGISLSLASWRWHQMLRLSNADLHPIASWRWTLIGHCFSAFLFGAAVSDVAKSTLYSRWKGFEMTQILAASALDRAAGAISTVIYGIATLLFAVIAAPSLPDFGWKIPHPSLWALLLGVVLLIAAGLGWRLRGRWLPQLRHFADRFHGLAMLLRARPTMIVLILGAGFLLQLGISCVLGCALRAVCDQPLPWKVLLWTFPVIGVVASLPATISGAGAREGASIVLWAAFGIASPTAFSASLLTLCVNLLWAIGGGLLLWREASLSAAQTTSQPR